MEFSKQKWLKKIFEGNITVSEIGYVLKITYHKREAIYMDIHDDLRKVTHSIYSGTRPYNYSDLERKQ